MTVAPLASETASEHIRNAQQLALDVESAVTLLRDAARWSPLQPRDFDTLDESVAALKRRLGWALAKVE